MSTKSGSRRERLEAAIETVQRNARRGRGRVRENTIWGDTEEAAACDQRAEEAARRAANGPLDRYEAFWAAVFGGPNGEKEWARVAHVWRTLARAAFGG